KRTGGAGGRRRSRVEVRISLQQTPDRARPRPNRRVASGGKSLAGRGLICPSSVSHSMLLSRDYSPPGGPPHVTRRRAVGPSVLLALRVGRPASAPRPSGSHATH